MSLRFLSVKNNIINKDVFVSDYFSITGQKISLEHFSSNYSFNTKITNFDTITGKSINIVPVSAGTLQVQYTATNYFTASLSQPIKIFSSWESFDETNARFVFEEKLLLPHSIEEINIQPNEWGVADIFNDSITKLHNNLEYLKSNTRILNSKAPSFYYGWFGTSISNPSIRPRWFSKTFGEPFSTTPSQSINKSPGFLDIVDFSIDDDLYVILDRHNLPQTINNFYFRFFKNNAFSTEIFLDDSITPLEELFINPVSLAYNKSNLFILDSIQNKLQKIKLEITNNIISYNVDNYIQGFGSTLDPYNFNTPTQMQYFNDKLWVLDYGNSCIKQYTKDLLWINTHEFSPEYKISCFYVHSSSLLFLLTETKEILVLDSSTNKIIHTFSLLPYVSSASIVSKIIIDTAGEFLYIITDKNVFKYTTSGYFITTLTLPPLENNRLNGGFVGQNKNLYFSSNHFIIKVQDFVETIQIGQTYNKFYWSLNDMLISPEEFASDINYNRCISRLIQNIKNFRDSIDHDIVEIKESTSIGTVTYLSLAPINADNPPKLHPLLEREDLKLGVNDFHVPQVFNSILAAIQSSLTELSNYLNIKPLQEYTITQISANNSYNPCSNFCWSWKALSYKSSSFPLIKICEYNPISWSELRSSSSLNSKNWSDAISSCCE